jgi:transposase-like protein
MPKPLSARKRNAVLADIRAARDNGSSAGKIARDHSIARSTVTKIAADNGLADAFERTQTSKAARAKQLDNKAKRAQLQSDLLDDAQKLRKRAWEPYKIVIGGPEGAEIVTLELPPLPDVRAAYTSIGIIADKDRAYERDKADGGGVDHAKSMLGRLFTGLAEVVGETETPAEDG